MARIKTVKVEYERKLNLGQYRSAKINMGAWADIEPGDDLHEVMHSLWEMCKNNVKAQALPLVARQKAEVEEIFLGLPLELREIGKEALEAEMSEDEKAMWASAEFELEEEEQPHDNGRQRVAEHEE